MSSWSSWRSAYLSLRFEFRWHVRYSRQQFERYKVLFHEFDEDGGDLRP